MTPDDALHVNDATRYLNYCKSPLRYCLNTEVLIMLHVDGHDVSGKVHISLSFLIFKSKSIILTERWN